LLFEPGVMVTSVPWQLESSAAVGEQPVLPDGPAAPPSADGSALRAARERSASVDREVPFGRG
jgi:hypothetical protein